MYVLEIFIFCVQQKNEYIKQLRKTRHGNNDAAAATDDDDDSAISAEQLSEFYKQFLDDNYELHRNYNRSAGLIQSTNQNTFM